MARRRFPLLRATAELVNAANGVQPLGREGYITLPVFAFGWPTSEMSPLYMAGSILDALRRGRRGDFKGWRGREFVETLRRVSTSTVAYAEIPHAQHAFDFYYGSPRAHYIVRAVEEFLSWVHATRG